MASLPTGDRPRVKVGALLRRTASSRWLHVALIAVAAGFFVQSDLISGDEFEVFAQTTEIVNYGTLFLDDYPSKRWPGRILIGEHGHAYSKYGIGYPLLAAGAVKIKRAVGPLQHVSDVVAFKWVCAFLFLLSAYVFHRLLERRLGWGIPLVLVTFAYLCSTQATFYAAAWSSNVSTMPFLVFAFYFFEISEQGNRSSARKEYTYLALCGACIGFAGLCRTFPFLIAAPFGVALLVRSRFAWRETLLPLVAMMVPVFLFGVALVLVNLAKAGTFLNLYGSEGFTTPFHIGLLGTLLWPGKSFIFFYPATVLFPFGIYALWRKHRSLATLCILSVAIYVVSYSKWWAWMSGPSLGNRFWLPALPFMLYPLGFLRGKVSIAAVCALVVFGASTQLLLYGKNPRPIFTCIYEQLDYVENGPSVRAALAKDFCWSQFRATFVRPLFYGCIQ